MALTARPPWYAKIAAKIVLSRLPIGYRSWRRLGLFRHGAMNRLPYAEAVFRTHYGPARFDRKGDGFACLELGPGDSLLSALIARAEGAARVVLVDSGDYALTDLSVYRDAARALDAAGARLNPAQWTSREAMLADCHATYLTTGLEGLRSVKDDSIDFIWSQAVLEHVRRQEFDETLRELHRVLRPSGVASHRVDLKDHLGGGLDNLRFSEELWEGRFFSSSGFYTNRLRFSEILRACERAGFVAMVTGKELFPRLPIARRALHSSFARFTDADLLVSGFDLTLKKA